MIRRRSRRLIELARPGGPGPRCRPARSRPAARPVTDRGAAAVEMAMVAPILIMLVFMIIDFGQAFTIQARLEETARQGVRTAVLTQAADPGPGSGAVAKAEAVGTMRDALLGLTTPSEDWVQPCAGTAGQATVTAVYDFQGTLFSRRLTGRAVMRCPG